MFDDFDDLDDGASRIATGLSDLDAVLGGGLRPGQLIVVAGEIDTGKTTLGLHFARAAAITQGKTAAVFYLEGETGDVMLRVAAAEAGLRLDALRRRDALTVAERRRLDNTVRALKNVPLYLDSAMYQPPNLEEKIQQLHRDEHLRIVVLDYLQLVVADDGGRLTDLEETLRRLKILARKLRLVIVVISHLRPDSGWHGTTPPEITDLDPDIELHADLVVLLHRPDAHAPDSPRAGEIDLILAKHRSGPLETIVCHHQLHLGAITNLPAAT